ncbi:hypothetical protein CY35_02G149800 [Sphagnum magellanicum]|nr:hypothetical protein CY35_02G149800 [Sphagnum magellanicum]KAH9572434.1 hypothetical protein CY35_02G149800 [Sphagnum magellanicum]
MAATATCTSSLFYGPRLLPLSGSRSSPKDALEPHVSKQTLEFHWGKHHRAYIDNLNKQIDGTDLERKNLEELVKFSYNNGNPQACFNNAAQTWNHDFFWSSIYPGGGGQPDGEVLELIERDFGSFEEFAKEFEAAVKDAKLSILKTSNALNPLIWGYIPLTVVDVWEHAYYLDFQNRRPDYLNTFLDKLISWEAVAGRLAGAKAFVNLGEPTIPEK